MAGWRHWLTKYTNKERVVKDAWNGMERNGKVNKTSNGTAESAWIAPTYNVHVPIMAHGTTPPQNVHVERNIQTSLRQYQCLLELHVSYYKTSSAVATWLGLI